MIVTSIGSGAACYSMDEAKDMNLSEYIRGKRCTMEITDEMFAHTRDLFEKAGVQEVTYPQYTKFAVIDTPSQAIEKEMAFVMDGFYTGRISEDEIKGFFLEYAHSMQARNESKILNLYESFLNISYERAVKGCFDEGKDIAEKEGVDTNKAIYYDADYYYQAEEIHEFLKEITEEYAAKYGVEIDIEKRESGFDKNPNYLTGYPSFNSKWNFSAHNVCGYARLPELDAVPPKGFTFFYKQRDRMLMVGGNGWSEKMDTSSSPRGANRYPRLSDLLYVDSQREEYWSQYNDFMKKIIIARQ
ncbi:MAG: hypothetical protein J6K48_03800 [Lachnospiraceae bacterium]|nr:hypothetical protein [Lachnospiraceae bacterium]